MSRRIHTVASCELFDRSLKAERTRCGRFGRVPSSITERQDGEQLLTSLQYDLPRLLFHDISPARSVPRMELQLLGNIQAFHLLVTYAATTAA